MKQHRLMSRIAALAVGLAVAVSAMALASAQDPQEPPFRFYGHGANAGDTIGVHMNDDDLTPIDTATVDSEGSWYIDVDRDEADDVVFSINGEVADSEIESTGSGQSAVTLTAKVMEEEDDSMMDEGDDGEMSEDDETMMEEDGEMSDDGDSMMDEDSMEDGHMDDSMEDDHMDESMSDNGYPATGSGGLATDGVSAGLVGLLIALSAAAIAGIGVRRVRSRA